MKVLAKSLNTALIALKNPACKTLELLDLDLGVDEWNTLFEVFKENTTLIKLKLSATSIGETWVTEALAAVLKKNTTLTKLDLGWNKIGDAGAEAIAEMLKGNTTLTELKLMNNNISKVGAIVLAIALKKNATLTKLELQYNYIGNAGAKSLAGNTRLSAWPRESKSATQALKP